MDIVQSVELGFEPAPGQDAMHVGNGLSEMGGFVRLDWSEEDVVTVMVICHE